jgi:uncharacterized membrane protein
MEAFSDGVIAILITIMVLELGTPHGADLEALLPLAPVFLSYVLSFAFIAIYWNNHHHLLQAARHVDGRILWANMILLFSLSLVPFTTAWMGENGFAPVPVAAYGVDLLLCAIAYTALVMAFIRHEGPSSVIATAIGPDPKGRISLALYAIAIPLALVFPPAAVALFAAVSVIWVVPDDRIERVLEASHDHDAP